MIIILITRAVYLVSVCDECISERERERGHFHRDLFIPKGDFYVVSRGSWDIKTS